MIELIGVHRVDETHFIDDFRIMKIRHGVGQPRASVAVLSKLSWRPHELWNAGCKREGPAFQKFIGARFVSPFDQLRLVVVAIQIRW